MAKYRHHLPQLNDKVFLTDGGLETTLMFHEQIDLPHMAAFTLLKDPQGAEHFQRYFQRYLGIARDQSTGFILGSPTWRANPDWGQRLGYDAQSLAEANREGIELISEVRKRNESQATPIILCGDIGPRGDGYRADFRMSAEEARGYHAEQIETFALTEADMVCALTLNYVDEAVGLVNAAKDSTMPIAVSFTVETDGRLPSGETLAQAISETDARTDNYAAYFMINCAHPSHFSHILARDADWCQRLRGIRANASRCSHAELDESTELDDGNPQELGAAYRELREMLPNLTVIGGCCGTDHRHVAEMGRHCLH